MFNRRSLLKMLGLGAAVAPVTVAIAKTLPTGGFVPPGIPAKLHTGESIIYPWTPVMISPDGVTWTTITTWDPNDPRIMGHVLPPNHIVPPSRSWSIFADGTVRYS